MKLLKLIIYPLSFIFVAILAFPSLEKLAELLVNLIHILYFTQREPLFWWYFLVIPAIPAVWVVHSRSSMSYFVKPKKSTEFESIDRIKLNQDADAFINLYEGHLALMEKLGKPSKIESSEVKSAAKRPLNKPLIEQLIFQMEQELSHEQHNE